MAINTKDEFLTQIAKPTSIAAINRLLSSRLFKYTLTSSINVLDVYYNRKGLSRIAGMSVYLLQASVSGLTLLVVSTSSYLIYNLPLAPLAMLNIVSWRGFETGALWGIAKNSFYGGNLSLLEMITFLGEEVLTKEIDGAQKGLLHLLESLNAAGSVDTILNIAEAQTSTPKKPKGKKAKEEIEGEGPAVPLGPQILESLLSTAQKLVGADKFIDFTTQVLGKNQILNIISSTLIQSMESANKKLPEDIQNPRLKDEIDTLVGYISKIIGSASDVKFQKQILNLLSVILKVVSGNELNLLLAAISKKDLDPKELSQAALPIARNLLGDDVVRQQLAAILSNKAMVDIIGAYTPENLRESIKALVGDAYTLREALELAHIVVATLEPDDDIAPLFTELLKKDQKPEIDSSGKDKDKGEEGDKDKVAKAEEKLTKLLETSTPMLNKLCNTKDFKDKVVSLLHSNTLIVSTILAAYNTSLIDQATKKAQKADPKASLSDVEKASIGEAVNDLGEVLTTVMNNKYVLGETLNLLQTILNVAYAAENKANFIALLKELAKTPPKDQKIPVDRILSLIPILQKELDSKDFRTGAEVLIKEIGIDIGLNFYEKALLKGKVGKELAKAKAAFAKAQDAVNKVIQVDFLTNALELCNALVGIVSIDNLRPILTAYNDPETQAFLKELAKKPGEAKDPNAPALPAMLIQTVLPLVRTILANGRVRGLLVTILSDQGLVAAIEGYLPENMKEPIRAIMEDVDTLRKTLELADTIVSKLEFADLAPLLTELLQSLPEEAVASDKEERQAKILEAYIPMLNKLLSMDNDFKEKLVNLLDGNTSISNTSISNTIIAAYRGALTDQAIKKAREVNPEAALSENARDTIQDAVEDLRDVLNTVINNKSAIINMLELLQTTLGVAYAAENKAGFIALIKELVKTPPKDQKIPVDLVLSLIPILQKELDSASFRAGVETLIREIGIDIGMSFYEKTLLKGKRGKELEEAKAVFAKAQEAVGKIIQDEHLITNVLQLCSTIAGVVSVDNLRPILTAYNTPETQAFFKEIAKKPGEAKDANALAIPTTLILAALPLLQNLFSKAVREGLHGIITNPTLLNIGLGYYKDSLQKDKAGKELEKANAIYDAVSLIIQDGTLITKALELCSNLVSIISVENLAPILNAYNDPETQSFLKEIAKKPGEPKDLTAPALPAKLIQASLPLVKVILGNPAITATLKSIAASSSVEAAVKGFFGADSAAYRNFTWVKANIDIIFDLAPQLISGDARVLNELIADTNAYLVARNQEEGATRNQLDSAFIVEKLVVVSKDTTGILGVIGKNAQPIATLINSYPDYDKLVPVKFRNLDDIIAKAIPIAQVIAATDVGDMKSVVDGRIESSRKSAATDEMKQLVKEYVKDSGKAGAEVAVLRAALAIKLQVIVNSNKDKKYFSDLRKSLMTDGKGNIPILKGIEVPEVFDFIDLGKFLETIGNEIIPSELEGSMVIMDERKPEDEYSGEDKFGMLDLISETLTEESVQKLIDTALSGIMVPQPNIQQKVTVELRTKEIAAKKLQEQIVLVKALLKDVKVKELIPPLLEAIKLMDKLDAIDEQIKLGNLIDRTETAAKCADQFNVFFKELEKILISKQYILNNRADTIAGILDDAIPPAGMVWLSYLGYNTKYLADKIAENPKNVTSAILPNVIGMVLGTTGVAAGVSSMIWNAPTFALKQLLGAVTIPFTSYSQHDYIYINDIAYSRGGVNTNLRNSDIETLSFDKSNIPLIDVSNCSIRKLDIQGSNLKGINFDNSRGIMEVSIQDSTMDAKSFISLMRAVYPRIREISISNLRVEGNLCANGATEEELVNWVNFSHYIAEGVQNNDPVFQIVKIAQVLLDRTSHKDKANLLGFITEAIEDLAKEGVTANQLATLGDKKEFVGSASGLWYTATGLNAILDTANASIDKEEIAGLKPELISLFKKQLVHDIPGRVEGDPTRE